MRAETMESHGAVPNVFNADLRETALTECLSKVSVAAVMAGSTLAVQP